MRLRIFLAAFLVLEVSVSSYPQAPTLRELVAEAHDNVALTKNVHSRFPPLTFDEVLSLTDLVIRGVIGRAEGHLSEDGSDIYTTYELVNAEILFAARVQSSPRPGPAAPMTFALPGGSVPIDGFTSTVRYNGAPEVKPGMDVILLLKEAKGNNWPAAGVGVFEVRGGGVVPLDRGIGGHREFEGASPDKFLSDVVTRRGKFQP